jgi:hypothetical protein
MISRADRNLTGGLLDRSSVPVDDDPFPVRRFIAHNDDIAFETRNIFRDERLVLRRNENPVTDWVNARRNRIELYHDVPAAGSLKDRVIIPDVLVIELRIGLLRMHNNCAAGRPESVEEKSIEYVAGKEIDLAEQENRDDQAVPSTMTSHLCQQCAGADAGDEKREHCQHRVLGEEVQYGR